MKKAISVMTISVLIGSLFLAMYAGPVQAFSTATQQIFSAAADSTFDGKWTTNTEWDDGATSNIASGGTNTGIFRNKWYLITDPAFLVYDEYIIEALTDTTNDAGDYVQIIYCTASDGGTAPKTDDFRIDYVGHGATATKTTYKGTGTAWAAAALTDVTIAQLMSISKLGGSTPHWTTEVKLDKSDNGGGMNNYIMVSFYDASNPTQGVCTWPPSANANVPDTWGLNDAGAFGAIPESLGIGTIMVLASVAMIVGFVCLRKLPKKA
jgi:hypothetical protein